MKRCRVRLLRCMLTLGTAGLTYAAIAVFVPFLSMAHGLAAAWFMPIGALAYYLIWEESG